MEDIKIKELLDHKCLQYRTEAFIEEDPIQIPRRFSIKQDIEIAGFLAATIAWGKRSMIIDSADKMMGLMKHEPYRFLMHYRDGDIPCLDGSIHRTFRYEDFLFILLRLQNLYRRYESLEEVFRPQEGETNMMGGIERFRAAMNLEGHRSSKHVSSPARNSAAKRLNMYLRWMVRIDEIDLGVWESISPAQLSLPLDVHTARVARALGLLKRKQNDRKAVEELDRVLRQLDPEDPVRYDFALFGMGAYEGFGASPITENKSTPI